jgi:hypothetical protein
MESFAPFFVSPHGCIISILPSCGIGRELGFNLHDHKITLVA